MVHCFQYNAFGTCPGVSGIKVWRRARAETEWEIENREVWGEAFWTELCGRPVEQLWSDYQKIVESENEALEEGVVVEKEDATGLDGEPTPMDVWEW
jgi:hypothetical protein